MIELKRVAQLFTHESRHSQDTVLSADQCADGVLSCEGTLRAITSAAVECTRQIRGRLGAGAVWTKHPLWPTITPYCFPRPPRSKQIHPVTRRIAVVFVSFRTILALLGTFVANPALKVVFVLMSQSTIPLNVQFLVRFGLIWVYLK